MSMLLLLCFGCNPDIALNDEGGSKPDDSDPLPGINWDTAETGETGVVDSDTSVDTDTGAVDSDVETGADSATDTGETAVETGDTVVDTGCTTYVTLYPDLDGDGYGDPDGVSVEGCPDSDGYVTDNTDCDDARADVNPGVIEVCDGSDVDENCDGLVNDDDPTMVPPYAVYEDADGDGYGDPGVTMMVCESPDASWIGDSSDCDDGSSAINPAAAEVCDEVDNNCDGSVDNDATDGSTWYTDADGDGYGDDGSAVLACGQTEGAVPTGGDCDDTNVAVNPSTSDSVYTVWDDDCDGVAFTGRELASGVVATSESFVATDDATFEGGVSASWDVISLALGRTAADLTVTTGVWEHTLVGEYDGLTFFGTGGTASQDDEYMVYSGALATADGDTVFAGDELAIVFSLDSDAGMRYGIGVYVGDATDTSTWMPFAISSPIEANTDVYEVTIGTAGMDNPNVILCAGGVEFDGEVRFAHIAVVRR